MTKLKASDKFHKEENFNCAQAVLKFFEDHPSVTEQDIADYKAWGGGRAPEGICGAIFATEKILNDHKKLNALNEHFEKHAGSCKCREIKQAGIISCAACVDLAADFVADEIQKS